MLVASKTVALSSNNVTTSSLLIAGAETEVGHKLKCLTSVTEATEARAESVTSVAVTTVEAAIEATAPKLTVVAEIAAASVIPVRPERVTAPPDVIVNAFAEVTPARLTAPVAVISTAPEKEAAPNENSVDPSTVIVVVV